MNWRIEAEGLWFLMQQSDNPALNGMVLTCYCDDSGTHEESKYAVLGGLILSKRNFFDLSKQWQKILSEFRIEKIHMQDFVRPYGRYSAMNPEMKIALFLAITKAILNFKTYSVSVAVLQSEYKAVLSMEVYRKLLGPYALAFLAMTTINKRVAEITSYKYRLAYLVDQGSENHHDQLKAAHYILQGLEEGFNNPFIGAMAFDTDDRNYALQAADVIAWAAHRALEGSDFGEEFAPLKRLLRNQLVKTNDAGRSLHLELTIPAQGLKLLAERITQWEQDERGGKLFGGIPTWKEMDLQQAMFQKSLMDNKKPTEEQKFDTTVRTILSVTREELQRREKKWKQEREKKKRAKSSPVSRASDVKD